MRDLNEILTLRAKDRIRERAEASGVSEAEAEDSIADAMAVWLRADRHTVRRQLHRILAGKTGMGDREVTHRWRADYMEAFADAAGLSIAAFISTATGTPHAEPPNMSQRLFSMVGKAVENETAERAVDLTRDLLKHPGRFDLSIEIGSALAAASSPEEALAAIAKLVYSPAAAGAFPEEKRAPGRPARNSHKGR